MVNVLDSQTKCLVLDTQCPQTIFGGDAQPDLLLNVCIQMEQKAPFLKDKL